MYADILSSNQVSRCPDLACCLQMVKLKAFGKFENTTDALAAAASLVDSKLSKGECPLPSCPAGPTIIRSSERHWPPWQSVLLAAPQCLHPFCTLPNCWR